MDDLPIHRTRQTFPPSLSFVCRALLWLAFLLPAGQAADADRYDWFPLKPNRSRFCLPSFSRSRPLYLP